MPFEEDEADLPIAKVGLKNISSKKSMFDDLPKKPTQKDLDKKVQAIEDKDMSYKQRASELAIKFRKLYEDKTLPMNRGPFAGDLEKEVLSDMISLAIEINNDPEEQNEGMGSLSWITFLFKICLAQRDRLNKLEYSVLQMEKNYSAPNLLDLVKKEISKALDMQKNGE